MSLFIYCIVICYFWLNVNQACRRWTIFKICMNKTLSSSSSKASEPLINSTYSFLYLCNA
jgi:hypothetical protein